MTPPPRGEPLLKFGTPEVWQTTEGLAVRGWILTENGPPESLEIWLGDEYFPVASWHARPDIVAKHPEFNSGDKCGFWAYLPTSINHRARIKARTADRVIEQNIDIGANPTVSSSGPGPHLFERFRAEIDERKLSVLEIDSGHGPPGPAKRGSLFPAARSYTCFNYDQELSPEGSPNVLALSSYFQERFDAIFSFAVLEHLAMPWVAAMEINRALNLGGLTYHQTHFTFPIHGQPRDYWRFSDQGLRVLFSQPLGWEVLDCEFMTPVRLYPEESTRELLQLPSETGFIHVAVLARKIAEIDISSFRWKAAGSPDEPADPQMLD